MRPGTKAALDAIVDVFTGADGGGDFVIARATIAEMDRQAAAGDRAAAQVIALVCQFSRLVTMRPPR